MLVGGKLSERKGVNVPGVVLPITALTGITGIWHALELGADWSAIVRYNAGCLRRAR
jgi:pyruvate kinase